MIRQAKQSIGVATIPETSADKKGMVADADRALYVAKDQGRNRAKRSS